MAENRNINAGRSGSNTFLAFVLGAVVLAIGIFGYFMLGGDDDADVQVNTPSTSAPATSGSGMGNAPSAPSGGGGQPSGGGTQ